MSFNGGIHPLDCTSQKALTWRTLYLSVENKQLSLRLLWGPPASLWCELIQRLQFPNSLRWWCLTEAPSWPWASELERNKTAMSAYFSHVLLRFYPSEGHWRLHNNCPCFRVNSKDPCLAETILLIQMCRPPSLWKSPVISSSSASAAVTSYELSGCPSTCRRVFGDLWRDLDNSQEDLSCKYGLILQKLADVSLCIDSCRGIDALSILNGWEGVEDINIDGPAWPHLGSVLSFSSEEDSDVVHQGKKRATRQYTL